MTKEIRFGIVGNVDSGKSTFIGVFKNKKYDNGKGSARSEILQCLHEKLSGRTSTISQQYIKLKNNYSFENKSLVFIDLAGHEKYLKTTLHGLTGYYIDHVFVLVGANMGVSRMTREHLSVVMSLGITYSIIITKIDIAPLNIYMKTLTDVKKMITRMSKRRKLNHKSIVVNNKRDIILKKNNILIFNISNKTGKNFDLVRMFIDLYNENYIEKTCKIKCKNLFIIDKKYNVPNIGHVVSGKALVGNFNKQDNLFIGPFKNEWYPIVLKSFHDNFRKNIDIIKQNESGTIAFKYINLKKDFIKQLVYNKSLYIIHKNDLQNMHYRTFDAEVKILVNHSTTIKENYEPVINCNKIVQSAKINKIYNKKYLRAGDISNIQFSFTYRPEFIKVNDTFIFRDGNTKGIGKIIKLYN